MDRGSLGGGGGSGQRPVAGTALSRPSRLSTPSSKQGDPLGQERHSGPPRTLNVWEFASERAAEIKSLNEVLKSRGGESLFTLARHLRRRTTSHSRRQFLFRPKKQKVETGEGEEQADGSESKPQSRKVRRRAMLQAIRRGECDVGPDGSVRLETHVWQAKRFAMEHFWGYVLAAGLPGRGRGSRSVLRGAKTAALVHDATYVQPIQLEGPQTAILQVLESVSFYRRAGLGLAGEGMKGRNAEGKLGSVAQEVMLHRRGEFPRGAIAPATLMWRSERRQSVDPVAVTPAAQSKRLVDEGPTPADVSMGEAAEEATLGDFIPLETAPSSQMGLEAESGRGRIAGLAVGGNESKETDSMEIDGGGSSVSIGRGEDDGTAEAAGQCLVWVHAAAFEEALGLLQGACAALGEGSAPGFPRVRCRSRKGEFVRLDLVGAEARAVLSKVLRPVRGLRSASGARTCESEVGDTWQWPASSKAVATLPPRAILSLTVEDPRLQPRLASPNEQPEVATLPALQTNLGVNTPPRPAGVTSLSVSQPTLTPSGAPKFAFPEHLVERPEERPFSAPTSGAERPPSTPRTEEAAEPAIVPGGNNPLLWDPPRRADGKPLWPKPASESILNDQRRRERLASFGLPPESADSGGQHDKGRRGVLRNQGMGGESENGGQAASCCPVWLVHQPAGAGFAAGWTLIAPSGWALPFWVPLVYAGAHAVGQLEQRWVATEAGVPVFPDDYPDCPAYTRTARTRHQKLLDKYSKKPPAKRPPKPPPLPDWDLVCGMGASESSADEPMRGQVSETSTSRRYFVARNSATLAKAAGAVRVEEGRGRDPGRSPQGVRQGLRSGKLMWKAVGSEAKTGALPREPGGSACALVEALLKMPRKGVPEEGAEILVPREDDFEAWCKSRTWQGILLSPETGGKREKGLAEGGTSESRPVMGYVTSPSAPSGSAQGRAFVVCHAPTFQRLRARQYTERAGSGGSHVFVLVHNLGSNMGRPGLVTLRLESNW